MNRTRMARLAAVGTAVLSAWLLSPPAAVHAAPPTDPGGALPTANTAALKTWTHANAVATSGPIAGDKVRRSPFYDASVSLAHGPKTAYTSFVYMSVPRGGNGKIGYTDDDGAEFAADAGYTMSWSSFQYAADVWVNVTLKTGQEITSAKQVTIRPANLGFQKQLVNSSTVRVKVPYNANGYRFSVEFDPQLVTAYNDLSGGSGRLTTTAAGNRAIDTEPQNSMLVFANPAPSAAQARQFIPTANSGSIYRPSPGLVNNLNAVTQDIIYFEPGTYYMGSNYHAVLPANVKWVYLAPGAYVKGAFRFLHDTQSQYKVTGLGVLSGEQYVYEPDTANGYNHKISSECHVTCVKMLQFESSNTGQTLALQGLTVANPPYHSFVVYAHEQGTEISVENFRMNVQNYKQVGGWYWQTDGMELYDDGQMTNTFFHANDDVLKIYHNRLAIKNTVIWKNENGPVIQWGWTPRNIDGVNVTNTDVIHSRMYWKDVKYNTCVFNSSSHYEDMGATDRADLATTVKNMTFTNTRVEGAVNCAIRIFALSNTENININGLAIDKWNDLDLSSQASKLKRYTNHAGAKVTIGNEVTDGNGLRLHNYTVGGVPIAKAGNQWASDELGRLDFDADTWDSWNATYDGQPTGPAPALTINGPADGTAAASDSVTFSGTTDAARLTIRVNGTETKVPLRRGRFSTTVTLPNISNRIVITAIGRNGVMTVDRRSIIAYGTKLGTITDPTGDDNGPGTYTYPTNPVYEPGIFDLRGLDVYRSGSDLRFVTTIAGPITNPFGGDQITHQRINIYLGNGSGAATPALPGTNMDVASGWSAVVVQDGRFGGAGVFAPDGSRIGDATLTAIPETRQIVATIAASSLGSLDPATARYGLAMFGNAEPSEGIGNVRPVYDPDFWQNPGPDLWWITQYRFGGGAGVWTDQPSHDSDTSDPNALDIAVGVGQSQATVMDWQQNSPVTLPMIPLN